MRKPVIGITLNVYEDPHYDFAGYPRVVINEDYSRSVIAAGGVPVMLPPSRDVSVVADQLACLDGVLLSGGTDVQPLRYGQQHRRPTHSPNVVRDAYEWEVLRVAEERGLPTFGICRGMQLMNAYYGGTLFQDTSEQGTSLRHDQDASPAAGIHEASLTGFTAEAIGRDDAIVNSFHHQAVDAVAPGFRVAATAPDGIVEAIERPGDRLLAAVQWHPEMASRENPDAQALFAWVIEKMRPASS